MKRLQLALLTILFAAAQLFAQTHSGGGGGTGGGGGCTPTGVNGNLLLKSAGNCPGAPNSSVDALTGDVTLGDNIYGAPVTRLGVYSTDGMIFVDNSDAGTTFYELPSSSGIAFHVAADSGLTFDTTGDGILGHTGT